MATDKISTLSQFFKQSGAKYRVFNLGRRVVKLSPIDFANIEDAKLPYPYPFQKSALLGIVFWNPDKADNRYVWFLNFPLDEQGLLIQAARDEFLVMLLDRVGELMLANESGGKIEGALKDSPYAFKPREDRMSAFNALVTQNLTLPPSQYFNAANAYFMGESDLTSWQSLGMQGIADFAARLNEPEEVVALIEIIPLLPSEPFMMLTTFLENVEPATGLVEELAAKLKRGLQVNEPNVPEVCACLRAASNSPAKGLVGHMVKMILQHECSKEVEVLATISGRVWEALEDEALCLLFIERLANNSAGQGGFSQLLADLMFIPSMRSHVMVALRSPTRSPELTKAVGYMFG